MEQNRGIASLALHRPAGVHVQLRGRKIKTLLDALFKQQFKRLRLLAEAFVGQAITVKLTRRGRR